MLMNKLIKVYAAPGCGRCAVLKKKLDAAGLEYEYTTEFDTEAMINRGFDTLPVVEYLGEFYDMTSFLKILNERV